MNTKSIIKRLIIVFAVLCLTACAVAMNPGAAVPPAGQVWSVSLSSTIGGIMDCINRAAGTAIIAKGDSVIFEWRMGDGWAFSGFNSAGQDAINKANMTGYQDGSEIMRSWMSDGWQYISPRNLPQPVLDALAVGFVRIAGQLTTFAVIPMGQIDPGQYGAIQNPAVNQ